MLLSRVHSPRTLNDVQFVLQHQKVQPPPHPRDRRRLSMSMGPGPREFQRANSKGLDIVSIINKETNGTIFDLRFA